MKRLLGGMLCLLLLTSSVNANNVNTLIDDLYNVIDLIQSNERKINRRDKLANDLKDIINVAKIDVRNRLKKRGGGRPGQIDMHLVKITINSCQALGYWNERVKCFKTYLENQRGVLGAIYNSCSAIQRMQEVSSCFYTSLLSIKEGETNINELAAKACNQVGYWNDRSACFTEFSRSSTEVEFNVASVACKAATTDQEVSKCFTVAYNYNLNNFKSVAGTILASCNSIGYWNQRVACFKAGVRESTFFGFQYELYSKGCFALSRDQEVAKCFNNALKGL